MKIKKVGQLNTFRFRKTDSPKIDKLYLLINFAGGDADTKHPEYHEFRGIKFSEYETHLDEINKVINEYQTLQRILDINSRDHCDEYEKIEAKFGKDIAHLWEEAPNDPQNDYQNKTYIRSMELIGYDIQGHKHESYISRIS